MALLMLGTQWHVLDIDGIALNQACASVLRHCNQSYHERQYAVVMDMYNAVAQLTNTHVGTLG